MKRVFFIVGPTATGKSEIAAEIACRLSGEIINADAFQIYRGLHLLTATPDGTTRAKAPHHLLGAAPVTKEMNVETFRVAAVEAIRDIQARGKHAIVAGGSGLYVKALTHGLARLPIANSALREELNQATIEELFECLRELDPAAAEQIDRQNKRRLIRAVEVCLLTGKPFSAQRREWHTASPVGSTGILPVGPGGLPPVAKGVFVFRDRAELYERIERRVEKMFADGVVDEVRALGDLGSTAAKALGVRDIQALLAGELSEPECIAKIQQATRRYAKRQLTWFQRQSNFEALNLSLHGFSEATELIAQRARLAFTQMDD